jgi:hypothetical protein
MFHAPRSTAGEIESDPRMLGVREKYWKSMLGGGVGGTAPAANGRRNGATAAALASGNDSGSCAPRIAAPKLSLLHGPYEDAFISKYGAELGSSRTVAAGGSCC